MRDRRVAPISPKFALRLACLIAILAATRASAQCLVPAAPAYDEVPASVTVGQTYAISWSPMSEVTYLVERSRSVGFNQPEVLETDSIGSSWVASRPGRYHHRIAAIPICDRSRVSPFSQVRTVEVNVAEPVVSFARLPESAFLLADQTSTTSAFALENLGSEPVIVELSSEPLGSDPFFHIESEGRAITQLELAPRVPRPLTLRFNPPDQNRSEYQGFLRVHQAVSGRDLYAYVELKTNVTEEETAANPVFLVDGVAVDTASFDPHPASTTDATREPLVVEIHNPGDQPLLLVGNAGPDPWLIPQAGWNADSIEPGSSISIALRTDRNRVVAERTYPRQTFFTVRSLSGSVARLLIQDFQATSLPDVPGLATVHQPPSHLFTAARIEAKSQGLFRMNLRIANPGDLPASLVLRSVPIASNTPAGTRSVTIGANEALAVTDILGTLFEQTGVLARVEIIPSDEATASLLDTRVSLELVDPLGGTVFQSNLPVFRRGEGAVRNAPHRIVPSMPVNSRAVLWLIESSLEDGAIVEITIFDLDGSMIGSFEQAVDPGHIMPLPDALDRAGLPFDTPYGWMEISSVGGAGSVAGWFYVVDNDTNHLVSTPVSAPIRDSGSSPIVTETTLPYAFALLGAMSGTPPDDDLRYHSELQVTAPEETTDLILTYQPSGALARVQIPVRVEKGATEQLGPILDGLFSLTPGAISHGAILIHASSSILAEGRLVATPPGKPSFIAGPLPVIDQRSSAFIGANNRRSQPVYADGIQQRTDGSGSQWNLLLSEVSGRRAGVEVRLYEQSSRTVPVATRKIRIPANGSVLLETLFDEMGLNDSERRRDRLNVRVVVTPDEGNGTVAVVAIERDPGSGDEERHLLTPNGGVAASSLSKLASVSLPVPTIPTRKRPTKRD